MGHAVRVPLLRAVALLLAAFALATMAIALRPVPDAAATWWPATGLFIGAVVLSPRRWWPAIGLAIALIAFTATQLAGRPVGFGLGLSLGNAAEALVAATVLRRLHRGRPVALVDTGDYLRLLAAVAAGACAMTAFVVATAMAVGIAPVAILSTLVPGHLAGALVVLPLLLIGGSALPRGRQAVELAAQAALLAGAMAVSFVFIGSLAPLLLPMPLLVWAALRFSPMVAAAQVALVALAATSATTYGVGPIAAFDAQMLASTAGDPLVVSLTSGVNVQLFVICLSVLAVPTALAASQRALLVSRLDAERRLSNTTLDTTAALILVADPDGIVTQANAALTRLTGFAPADVLGRHLWEIPAIPLERRALVEEAFGSGQGSRVPRTREADLMTANGQRIRVVWSNNVVRDASGRVLHMVCTATDVTSERSSRQLVEHLFGSPNAAPMLSLDPAYTVTLCNRASAELLGVASDDVVGNPFTELMCESEQTQLLHALELAAVTSRESGAAAPLPHDWTWHRPDGRVVRLAASVSSVLDAVGSEVGYLLVASDVTEKQASRDALSRALETEREAVQRLRRLDEARNEFVSTVSHELRTPTTSIVGYTEMLRDGEAGEISEDQQALLDVIARNGKRLIAVANDLLTLSGLESSEQSTWVAEQVDLGPVVTQAGEAVASLVGQRVLDVAVEVPEHAVTVVGDGTHLDRVLTNLLSNAVKFTPDHGTVRCRLSSTDEDAVIEVSDTGIGIPEDEQDELFTKFFRSSTAQDRAIPGTGLGLAIVRQIVEEHGGRIEVRSAHQQGTTFTVTLPLAAAATTELLSAG